ncbi:MAG: response regulator transcription factor [Thermoanaerobacterales bacterium]|nr:response regulator transcription factor [Bacillota bacterium]MDI6907367.1 response regulator transcription factor [Thermoanaerobacterales bacterium]
MTPVRLLIVDDHALIREGLAKILSTEPRVTVVGEAASGDEALAVVRSRGVDVVLLDVNMPGKNGIQTCREIKAINPEIGVIALTIHDQEEYLFEMIRAGVAGYVLKDISPQLLIDTILRVADGESFIPPSLVSKVFKEFNRLYQSPPKRRYHDDLTERELEVLQLVALGESNRAIAGRLFISEKTVKNHLTNIFQKIGVSDRTQAALYAVKNRLVEI